MEAVGMAGVRSWKTLISKDIIKKSTIGEYPSKDNPTALLANPLLCEIAFHEKPLSQRGRPIWGEAPESSEDLDVDTHLRFPKRHRKTGVDLRQLRRKYDWNKHIIARRSFAVFPPVQGMHSLADFHQDVSCEAGFGITMEHFVVAMESR